VFELAVEMHLVTAQALQLVGVERLTERLLADERPVVVRPLVLAAPRPRLIGGLAQVAARREGQERLDRGARQGDDVAAGETALLGGLCGSGADEIGETAEIGDDVSILHDVTLGGTGKEWEDRHPKIRYGVMIGAGAKILGNIEVGHCARIAAGSVVTKAVPNNVTVAGVPAKVIGQAGCPEPARTMDQIFHDGI